MSADDLNFGYPETAFRAKCLRVVDGDTVDLYVDLGFHQFMKTRFRLYGIDTAEMNSKDEKERELALKAKNRLIEILKPESDLSVLTTSWPLLVEVRKADNFGRWLVIIFTTDTPKTVNERLIEEGLAKEFKRGSEVVTVAKGVK